MNSDSNSIKERLGYLRGGKRLFLLAIQFIKAAYVDSPQNNTRRKFRSGIALIDS